MEKDDFSWEERKDWIENISADKKVKRFMEEAMRKRIFYNGYKCLKVRDKGKEKSLLVLHFNRGEFSYMPKWDDMNEILNQILFTETLNFGRFVYDAHYPPYIENMIRTLQYYLWKNPKLINKGLLKNLRETIDKLEELHKPKLNSDEKIVQIKAGKKILQLNVSRFYDEEIEKLKSFKAWNEDASKFYLKTANEISKGRKPKVRKLLKK